MPCTRLNIAVPSDYDLSRDVCSYGYFLLAPNHWDVPTRSLFRVLHLDDGPTTARISRGRATPGGECSPLRAVFDRTLSRAEQARARVQITRMLRLDETAEHLDEFHRLDPRFAPAGRGRLFRSPTLFEDVVKTVTSCNVTWPGTITMNARLCEVLGGRSPTGGHAFPTPAKLARARPGTLRARCRVGYRDTRLVELARLFHRGEIDEARLEDPATPDDEVFMTLKALPGVGPYAAGNIMQLLGRYSRLALDTESLRHARSVLGYEGTDRELLRRLEAHYAPFGTHKFRSYWFELWDFYERKAGPAHTWERETTGKTFTSALLKG
jgi:3-methyladenine DNA glycosylase/8-oxoguanine DNA glycosylase